jgi:hypothetical protein
MNYRMCELAVALCLYVITVCYFKTNPITNLKLVYDIDMTIPQPVLGNVIKIAASILRSKCVGHIELKETPKF